MYRFIVIFVAVLIVIGVTSGLVWVFRSHTAAPSTYTTTPTMSYTNTGTSGSSAPPQSDNSQSVAAVQAAYRAELAKHPSDNTKLYQTVISGGYALQVYAGDILGGEALLKYDQTQGDWVLVDGGGGAWSVDELIIKGVPRATATVLLAAVSQ